jgi:hypothetical protein
MKTGDILYWCVIDPHTEEILCFCSSRAKARDIAGHSGCRVGYVQVRK